MSWTDRAARLNWHEIEQWLRHYEALGPLPGIAVPMLESFLPFLPLVAILVANVNAYGLWEGLLLSWTGVVLGAISVFLLSRKFGGRFRRFLERTYPKSEKFILWVEQRGFTPIFLLSCFPFTPSFIVNVVSGISKIPLHTFVTATLLGKGVMIFMVSYAGHDLGSLISHPWKLAVIAGLFILLWISGRKLESRYLK